MSQAQMKVNEPVRPEFWTTDLYLAAFLQTEGVPLLRTEQDAANRRCNFVFHGEMQTTSLKSQWYNRIAMTNASSFADNIKSLKSLVHNGGR